MNQRRMLIVIISVIIAVMIIVPSTYVLLNSNAKQVIQKKKEPYITVSDGIANYTWNDSKFADDNGSFPQSIIYNLSANSTFTENNSRTSTLQMKIFNITENQIGLYNAKTNSVDIYLYAQFEIVGNISGDLVPSNITIITHSSVDRLPHYTNETYSFGWEGNNGLDNNISYNTWAGDSAKLNFTNESHNSSIYYYFGTHIVADETWYIFHPGENHTIEFAAILNGLSKQVFCQVNLNIGAIAS